MLPFALGFSVFVFSILLVGLSSSDAGVGRRCRRADGKVEV